MDYRGKFYPEIKAGGFTRVDGTIEFYARVNALLRPDMTVLDYGAGRGVLMYDTRVPYRTGLARLQGKVAKLVGADVDRAVLENRFVDEAVVFEIGKPLPFPDASFDLIVSDWVLEHVAEPALFEREVRRLLKPGGWFCARTPSKYGITGIGARLIPSKWHARLLKTLQPGRIERDVFPTTYRINTLGAVRRYFASDTWENASYLCNSEPPYSLQSRLAMMVVFVYWRLVPESLFTNLHVFMRKIGTSSAEARRLGVDGMRATGSSP